MATIPDEKKKPTLAERIPSRVRFVALIATSAAAASFADQPFAAGAVAGLIVIAWDLGRRR